MPRTALSVLLLCLVGCDDPKTASVADSAPAPVATDAAPSKPTWDAASMPPRPVPKSSPSVGSGMSQEVQMQAIAYMNAMAEPHPEDPIIDSTFVKSFIDQLKPVAMAADKGTGEAKAKLNGVTMIGGGRRIDVLLAQGCEADTPKHIVQQTGNSLGGLLDHGVLVVRCNDSRAQCLQSTRDVDDVLCTTAPRHKGAPPGSAP